MGPRAGLDRYGKSRPRWDSVPGPSSPKRVAILTDVNIKRCISQTQQNFIMFIIVLGRHVSILVESSSGTSKIQILT